MANYAYACFDPSTNKICSYGQTFEFIDFYFGQFICKVICGNMYKSII